MACARLSGNGPKTGTAPRRNDRNMKQPLPILVFTDLDGTLLDHHGYSYAPARPALDAIAAISGGVVLASSKTAAEIAPLRDELGLSDWPAIVENGAGLLEAGTRAGDDAGDYAEIRSILASLPQNLRSSFRGFGDMSATEVSDVTGLSEAKAALAKERRHSEPGIWSGSEADRESFIAALSDKGISARMGGRFLTLSLGHTKADRMDAIIDRFRPAHSVALGDAPNDVEMLDRADFGYIVTNPDAAPLPRLKGEDEGRIRRTELPGPAGWNAAILGLLSELQLLTEIG